MADKDRERLLDDDAAVLSVAFVPLRRANSVWKEAIDDKRRSELRRYSGCVSLELLLRVGILLHVMEMEETERNASEGIWRSVCPAACAPSSRPQREGADAASSIATQPIAPSLVVCTCMT